MHKLTEFVYNLVISGDLLMAKLLRIKVIEKALMLRQRKLIVPNVLSSRPIMKSPPSLLDLKSLEIGTKF
jgi:hypothetical protein